MDALIPLLLVSVVPWARSEPLREAMKRRSDYTNYASEYSQDPEPYMFAAIPLHPPMPVLHVLSPTPLSPGKRDLRHASSKHHPTYVRPPYAPTDYTRTFYGSSEHNRPSYASSDYAVPSYSQVEYTRPSYSDYHRPSYSQTDYMKPSYIDPEYTRSGFAEIAPESSYTRLSSQLSSAEVDYSPQVFPPTMPHVAYTKPAYQSAAPHPPHPPHPGSQETGPHILYAKPTAQGGYSYHKEPSKKRKSAKPAAQTEPPVIIRVHKYRITKS